MKPEHKKVIPRPSGMRPCHALGFAMRFAMEFTNG